MDNISFVAAVGASIVAGIILWWAYGRYRSPLARVLFSLVTAVIGFFVYLVLGILFVLMRPEIARQTGLELGHGFTVLAFMLIGVNAVIAALRSHKSRGTPNR